jgi:hypothetical protein
MSRKITLEQYLAWNTPDECIDVIRRFGYQANPRHVEDLVRGLKKFIGIEKEEGLAALMKIHPDREMILETVDEPTHSFTGDELLQGTGNQQPAINNKQQENQHSLFITHNSTQLLIAGLLGSAMLLSVAIIAKK